MSKTIAVSPPPLANAPPSTGPDTNPKPGATSADSPVSGATKSNALATAPVTDAPIGAAKAAPTTPPPAGPALAVPRTFLERVVEDPSRLPLALSYRTSLVTEDSGAGGVTSVSTQGFATPQAWASTLFGSSMNKLRQIAQSINDVGANFAYLGSLSAGEIRTSVQTFWDRGGGQCDGFHSFAAWAAVASGALPASDVRVVQAYANGGWHNVMLFKNPETHLWDVMNYTDMVHTGATSPSAAARTFFANCELAVVYEVPDKDKKPQIDYLMNSDHRATIGGVFAAPGLGEALTPSYGTPRGLNEPGGPSAPNLQRSQLQLDSRGVYVSHDGVSAAAMHDPVSGGDRYGASVLLPSGLAGKDLAGAKILVVREPTGGTSVFAGGEWWHMRDNAYIGVIGGVELRDNIFTQRLSAPLTELAPILGVNVGNSRTLIRNDKLEVTALWNGHLRLGVPFALTTESRAGIATNALGNSPGGYIDPGFVGLIDVGVNAGASARYRFTPGLTLDASAVARVQAMDPTFNDIPARFGVDGAVKLSYVQSGLHVSVGASGGTGIFDRDVVARGSGALAYDLSPKLSLSAMATAGQYKSGDAFAIAAGTITARLSKTTSVQLYGGAMGQRVADARAEVVPTFGLTLTHYAP